MTIAVVACGLPDEEVERFSRAEPALPGQTFAGDAQAASHFFELGEGLLRRLPRRQNRSAQEQAAAESIHAALRATRTRFVRLYASQVYAQLTDEYRACVRVEDLVYRAAEAFPGLVPRRERVLAEREVPQKDKAGREIDQGIFLSEVLSHPQAGAHLVWAMLRPRAESLAREAEFLQTGRLDLGTAVVERRGRVGVLWHRNPRFLNAEDDSTTAALEIGTDLLLLDPRVEVGVLRGTTVDHPKYAGHYVFNAGINLTHLYYGQISFVDFFIAREMGFVNKIYRGLSHPEFLPDQVELTHEKPWIAAVESFAIGGGCQLLLVMDYVVAERSSFFSLPARKEGIIPGVANLRLWRFVGDRLARQAILFDRQFAADSPEGRLICDEVVPDGEMDAALKRITEALLSSGVVSAAGNRKAIRLGQEPLDVFRQYLALYAREQAACHYSPQLIRNLEVNWRAHERRA
jgi:(3,5-dihydroxyphenyl)acetyl-CoA 1,2-dioxygenase